MIINDLHAAPTRSTTGTWHCLLRRGMLHSDCESVEHWHLHRGQQLHLHAGDAVEEMLLLRRGQLHLPDGRPLRAGQALFFDGRHDSWVRAGEGGAQVLSIRVLPSRLSACLPARVPELAPAIPATHALQ
ncbi:hypothetical protein [Kineococcus arenarius]|uniref:hypothetical protein n=1 Tax=unclassified Kineococcus TaxID=2621656 RepID=UPI003D7DB785